MPNLNRVQIIGRLGKDPEKKSTKNGSIFVVFSVAVNRNWKNHEGEWRKETDWFNVEAWGKLGENCVNLLSKGRLVFLEGRLRTSRYDHEGETRYFTKVVLNRMQVLDRPKEEEESADELLMEDEMDESVEE